MFPHLMFASLLLAILAFRMLMRPYPAGVWFAPRDVLTVRLRVFGVAAVSICASLLVFTAAARAQATTTTTVDLSPFAAWLQQYLNALLTALIIGLVTALSAKLSKSLGLNIEAKNRDALAATLSTAAGTVLAKVTGNIATIQFDVHNELIKQAVDYVLKAAPDALAHFEVGPDDIAEMILGKIGQLQASATTVAPTAVK